MTMWTDSESKHMDVLVVDDSASNLEMLKEFFLRSPYRFHAAENAKAALTLLEIQPCQIAIIDWMMPEINGLELVQQIRTKYHQDNIYIIMLTAKNNSKDRIEALQSGIDDFLGRPFSGRELLARVRIGERIVNNHQQIEQIKQEWETTVDALPEFVSLLNADGRILRVNRKYTEWGLGDLEQATNNVLHEALTPVYAALGEHLQTNWDQIKTYLDKGNPYSITLYDDPTKHYFKLNCEPIAHQDKMTQTASYTALTISDITPQRNLEIALQQEHEKSEGLLLNVLPEVVAKRLKNQEKKSNLVDEFDMATVLFSDIVGFTNFASSISPAELIRILNTVFSRFDALTEKHNLEKIKTIGDGYMVAAGVPLPIPNHAEAAIQMGFDMITAVAELNTTLNLNLKLRVGVHSGPLIAGVIGTQKFTYDLWGETVNIASRIESNGKPDYVHISQNTANLLSPEKFNLGDSRSIYLKGIGNVQTYLLSPQPQLIDTQ